MRKLRACTGCGEMAVKATGLRRYCAACTPIVRHIQSDVRGILVLANAPKPIGECVDCGAPAAHRDHRLYSYPLQVDFVCSGCNGRRGPALDIAEMVAKYKRILSTKYPVDNVVDKCYSPPMRKITNPDSVAAQVLRPL